MSQATPIAGLHEADEEIIAVCERLLEWAKSGDLRGLAYISVKPGSYVGTAWHGAPGANVHLLLSGAATPQYRLAKSLDDA